MLNGLRVGLALYVLTFGLARIGFGQSRWLELNGAHVPSIKLDTTTIELRGKTVFRVWDLITYKSPQHWKGDDGKALAVWSVKSRTDIDCEAKKQSLVVTYWFGKSGEPVWTHTSPTQEDIETVPESVGEAKVIGVCDFLRSTGRFKYFDIQ